MLSAFEDGSKRMPAFYPPRTVRGGIAGPEFLSHCFNRKPGCKPFFPDRCPSVKQSYLASRYHPRACLALVSSCGSLELY